MHCNQCQGVNIGVEQKVTVSGKYRYIVETTFCKDCRNVLKTERWSEEIQFPKDPKKDKDW